MAQKMDMISKEKIIVDLIKISFIYSMIKDGWRFRCISDKVYEFKKSRALVNDVDVRKILGQHFGNAFC
jgi:hypothetical protein